MVDQLSLDAVIGGALRRLAGELGMAGPEFGETGSVRLGDGDISVEVLGVPWTHEIEWWINCPASDTSKIHSDLVQEWLGEPIRAYQFDDSNTAEVVGLVSEVLKRALLALREDRSGALSGLREAEARIVERSRLARKRHEANQAWSGGDLARVSEIYSGMVGALTPVEAKRLQIAERKSPPSRDDAEG